MRKQFLSKFSALFLVLLLAVGANALAEDNMMNDDMTIEGTLTDAGYIDLTPDSARALIAAVPDLVIIDVSPKYDEGHLPRALHYYVGDGTLDAAIPMLDPSATYLVYCHVDSASILGATKLVQAGFDTVYRLEGNFGAWVEAGFPVSMLTMEEETAINAAAAAGTPNEAGFIDLAAADAKALIEAVPDLVIADVSPLFNDGHLPGAVNYFVGDGTLDNAIPMLARGVPYLVYCHTDEASTLGATKLAEAGFFPVFRLEGNFGAWVDAGFAVEK